MAQKNTRREVYLFTVNEVAELCRRCPQTVYRWVWEGRVDARRGPGNGWLIECNKQGWPYEVEELQAPE